MSPQPKGGWVKRRVPMFFDPVRRNSSSNVSSYNLLSDGLVSLHSYQAPPPERALYQDPKHQGICAMKGSGGGGGGPYPPNRPQSSPCKTLWTLGACTARPSWPLQKRYWMRSAAGSTMPHFCSTASSSASEQPELHHVIFDLYLQTCRTCRSLVLSVF